MMTDAEAEVTYCAHSLLGDPPDTASAIVHYDSTSLCLDCAWQEAEAALPEEWRPIHLAADDDDWTLWYAATATRAFFDGENENDAEHVLGDGPTPSAALRALAVKLEARSDGA